MSNLNKEVLFFIVVGTIGFIVDASVLTYLVKYQGYGLYEGRLISFLIAVTLTWYLNRKYTFKERASINKIHEWSRYLIIQVTGALINLGVYVAVIILIPELSVWPVIPLAIGSLIAMFFNFIASRIFAFSKNDLSV